MKKNFKRGQLLKRLLNLYQLTNLLRKKMKKLRYHRHRNNQVQKREKEVNGSIKKPLENESKVDILNSHQISQLKMKKQNLEKKLKRYNQDKSSKTRGS